MLLLVVVFGFDAEEDLIGAAVGHMYYFLVDVLPNIPETHGLKILKAPQFLVDICDWLRIHDAERFDDPELFGTGQAGWFFTDEIDEQ